MGQEQGTISGPRSAPGTSALWANDPSRFLRGVGPNRPLTYLNRTPMMKDERRDLMDLGTVLGVFAGIGAVAVLSWCLLEGTGRGTPQ